MGLARGWVTGPLEDAESSLCYTVRMATGNMLGLKRVPTEELRRMLRHLYRSELEFPLTPVTLTCVGLQAHAEPLMDVMRGLEAHAVKQVLVAVIAERMDI